jgi:hypothetical protein
MHRAHVAARAAAWLAASVLAIDCSEPTKPHASLTVAVVSGPIPGSTLVGGAPNWNTFTVDVVVRNESDVAAQLNPCGPQLEYQTPTGEWIVDQQLCGLPGGIIIEVAPRGERQFRETRIPPSRSVTGTPVRVRLMYQYFTPGVAGIADEARSEPFALK